VEFLIGDKVIFEGKTGVITDRMYSQVRKTHLFEVDIGFDVVMVKADVLTKYTPPKEYKITAEVTNEEDSYNLVVVVIYEDGVEVSRGHGHIIHEGAVGIAQAMSYASKRAFMKIDNGIYFKGDNEDDA
jgi:hypothetical protein